MRLNASLPRWRAWRTYRQSARIIAVQQISDMYYREGYVPRGTFRRLKREAYRRLRNGEQGPISTFRLS